MRLYLAPYVLCLAILSGVTPAFAALTPEEEVLKISKLLRPIPDEQWAEIAGNRISESYEINKGDTLYDISKRLFGDARFWPKIWALNNNSITNPHQIRPGRMIAFMSGTGSSLPTVAIQGDGVPLPPDDQYGKDPLLAVKGRSSEWKLLARQPWERVSVVLPSSVDPQGFDSRNKIRFKVNTGFDLHAIATSGKIPFLGEVTGARVENNNLSLGDSVYITSEQGLKVGDHYAVTEAPQELESKNDDGSRRDGYSYLILGEVKIIGTKDNHYVGTIVSNKFTIPREAGLMRVPPRVQNLSPIPGPAPLEARLFLNKAFSSYATAQHKQVILDRGSRDGIRLGMVFRNFQTQDPVTKEDIPRSASLMTSDVMIIQVSDSFSTGLVLRSLSPVAEGETFILMTDVSSLLRRRRGSSGNIIDEESGMNPNAAPVDELDQLEGPDDGLGSAEERELRQLELWEKNPETAPETAPAPEGEMPSEPAPEEAPALEPEPEMLPEELPETSFDRPEEELLPEEPMEAPEASLEPEAPSDIPAEEALPEELPEVEPTDELPALPTDELPPLPADELPPDAILDPPL